MAGGLIIYGIHTRVAAVVAVQTVAIIIAGVAMAAFWLTRSAFGYADDIDDIDFCGWVEDPTHNPLDDITDPDRAAKAGRGR